ncbi:hypothetical protein [Arthrobacter sp. zg-Y1143]|uniref:hypothetical protein n=1 Tax=Arthrobacter sp. zg-Y1143 TaxID=3049065 RepID=UPI0024C30F86|nr:hypothetical protein [Arthrobacter sp. zg-Y1143]
MRTPSRSIRVPLGGHYTLADRCRPYADLLPDAVVSHATAARLHGMVLPRRLAEEPVIHLSRPPGKSQSRRRHVVGHRLVLHPGEITNILGLPVTSIARTWLDLGGMLTLEELIISGDQVVSEHHRSFGPRRVARVPLPELKRYIEGKSGIAHLSKCRTALGHLRAGVDSPPETRLRLMLAHDPHLPEFLPNVAICDVDGTPQVWVDLGCRKFRTCLEYEGAHHLTPEQQAKDHHRDLLTAELGWVQVKISRADLLQGAGWVQAKVRRGLTLAGWEPPR